LAGPADAGSTTPARSALSEDTHDRNPTVPKPTPSDRIVGLVMWVNKVFLFSIFHA
jgi:hypothetical protein